MRSCGAGKRDTAQVDVKSPALSLLPVGFDGQPKASLDALRSVVLRGCLCARRSKPMNNDRPVAAVLAQLQRQRTWTSSRMLKGGMLARRHARDGHPLADRLDRERIACSTVPLFCAAALHAGSLQQLVRTRARSISANDLRRESAFRRHTVDRCILVDHLAAMRSVIAQQRIEHGTAPAVALLRRRQPDGVRVDRRDDEAAARGRPGRRTVVVSERQPLADGQRPSLDPPRSRGRPPGPVRRYATAIPGRIDEAGDLHLPGRREAA